MDLDIEETNTPNIAHARKLLDAKKLELQRLKEQVLATEMVIDTAEHNLRALTLALETLTNSLENPGASTSRSLPTLSEGLARILGVAMPVAYGEIKKAMREIVDRIGPGRDFTVRDIMNHLATRYPHINLDSNRSNFSSYLGDFVSEGLIDLKQEGSGQRPAIYRKK